MPLINMKQVEGGDRLQKTVDEMIKNFGVDKDTLYNSMLDWLKETAPADFDPTVNQNTRLDSLVNSVTGGEKVIEVPYLSFIEENGEPFTLKLRSESQLNGTLYYSTDAKNWEVWNRDITVFETLQSSDDGKLYLRGLNNTVISGNYGFIMSRYKHIQCIGNIETLLDYQKVQNGESPYMDEGCFSALFANCSELTKAPRLPSLVLSKGCYSYMFAGTSLEAPPSLPAMELAEECYAGMFNGCEKLSNIPILPARDLTKQCYAEMFRDCSSLKDIDLKLPATRIIGQSYYWMFKGCSNMRGKIHCCRSAKDIADALKIDNANVSILYDIDDGIIYPHLSFAEIRNEPFSLKTKNGSKNWNGTIFYSTNNIDWFEWHGEEIASSPNGRLHLRGNGNTYISTTSYIGSGFDNNFVLTENKKISCVGNIEALLDCREVNEGNHPKMNNNCYAGLFKDCTSLTSAPTLPATKMVRDCYKAMFSGCTSLTGVIKLPATELAEGCYDMLFQDCNALSYIYCPKVTQNDENRLISETAGTTAKINYNL